ncbi:hypothetical protein [Methylobacterium sp. BTF04]|uniref:hypothetical protein n=1 Tax=Methylobacterium sp. BTF04 TaxID=2708300 RepID=UPI0019538BF3|nr:hypothetical protein [Methylobacterium sp. BTF04]
MFASIFVSVASLIVLQVLLVVRVADWLSTSTDRPATESLDFVDRSAGRFTGIA